MGEFKKILAYADQYQKKTSTAISLLSLSVVLGIVPYFLVHQICMHFLGVEELTWTYLFVMAGLILLSLLGKTYTYFRGLDVSHHLAYDTLMGLRKKLADKVMRMPLGRIHRRGSGGLKKNFVDNVEEMELILAHAVRHAELIAEGGQYEKLWERRMKAAVGRLRRKRKRPEEAALETSGYLYLYPIM